MPRYRIELENDIPPHFLAGLFVERSINTRVMEIEAPTPEQAGGIAITRMLVEFSEANLERTETKVISCEEVST